MKYNKSIQFKKIIGGTCIFRATGTVYAFPHIFAQISSSQGKFFFLKAQDAFQNQCIIISPSKIANFSMKMKISVKVDFLIDFPMEINNCYSKISQLLLNNIH